MSIADSSGDAQDLTLFEGKSTTKIDAVGIILAAVYGVASAIPISTFFGAFGVTGSIGFSICIAPLFGILLGPYRGFGYGLVAGIIQAALATVVPTAATALVVQTMVFGPAVSGLLTGLALKRTVEFKNHRLPGPLFAALYLIVIIFLYEIPNYTAWWFMILYMLAVVVALFLQVKQIQFNPDVEGWRRYAQLIPFTIIGTMTDFSMMTLGAVYLLEVPPVVFGTVIFPFMLAERTAAIIVSAILGSVVLANFRDLWR